MKKNFYCSILCLIGLSFCANDMEASKKAAGVFLVSKNDSGQFVTLIGQRDDCDYWCNLGGQSEGGEDSFITAAREVFEESFGQFAIPYSILKNSRHIINKNVQNSQYGTEEYTMYFQYIDYIDANILNQIKDKKGEHSEYRQFAWQPLDRIEDDDHKLMPEFKNSIELSKGIIDSILDGSEKLEWQFDIETEKQNIINEQKGKIQNIIDDSTLDKSVLSPSLKFLEIILGKEKITEGVIQNDDLLWNYIVDFWNFWTSLNSRELQKKVKLDNDAKEAIISAIRFEQTEHLKGNRVVYHGLDGKLLFLYKYWGKIFSLIYGGKLDYVLRGDAANFIKDGKIRKLDEIIQNESLKHYGDSIDKLFLFVNPMLFLGSGVSDTTSSSLEYFLAQHSVKTHSLKSLLSTFFLMLGMDSGSTTQACNELKSLYRQFLKYNNADNLDIRCNGGLLAISIPKSNINGISISNSSYKDEEFDANKFFENVINYDCEWSTENKYDIPTLTNEFRVYLDPSYSFKINAFWHYSPKNYELFEHRLKH